MTRANLFLPDYIFRIRSYQQSNDEYARGNDRTDRSNLHTFFDRRAIRINKDLIG